ncbi:hypothetical protein L0337_35295 [candidate division KSB1 bacterium]|nr:hypothetical protein [candidate division KSB1 bacterium]
MSAGDKTPFPRGLSMQPAIGWYRPAFDFYNKQYARIDNNPFTNDLANSYFLPDLPGGRELGFEMRWRLTQRFGLGVTVSTLRSEIRAPLLEPGKPAPASPPFYSHRLDLVPVAFTAFLFQPLSRFAEAYLSQGIAVAKVEEAATIALAGDLPIFDDGSNATALLFGVTLGVQHLFAGGAYLFAEGQYVFGGYVANGWRQPRDPFKSYFLRRGSVSLAGPRVRLGLGFSITGR